MSVEIRWPVGADGRCMTDLGEIAHPNPRPDRAEVGALMLATSSYIAELKAGGPQSTTHGALHWVTSQGARDFAHIDYMGRHWVWELIPAHFSDRSGPQVLIGRWPD